VVFLNPYQGIDVFAFFLPTSKKLMWSSGRNKYENILIVKSKQGSKEKNGILLDQDVHVCEHVYIWWLT
jgi:hypothetical protein